MEIEPSLFRRLQNLHLIPPELPGLDIVLVPEEQRIKGNTGSPYVYNPVLIDKETANLDVLIDNAGKQLLRIINRFNPKMSTETASEVIDRQTYQKNLYVLSEYTGDLLKILGDGEEKKILKKFDGSVSRFADLIKILPEAKSQGLSEEFIKFDLAYLPHYFEWVYKWMDGNHLFDRYAESIKKILQQEAEKEKHVQKVSPLTAATSIKEKTFTGKVEKEPEEGNGLYITEVGSVHPNGMVLLRALGNKEVRLKSFKGLKPRSRGEIDIELPLDFISDSAYGRGKILPTHLGYKAYAVLFKDKNGNEIPMDVVTASRDVFGITTISKIPDEAVTVKYRLKQTERKAVSEIPEAWQNGIEVTWKREGDEIFDAATDRADSIERKLGLISEKLKRYPAIYTTDINIQKILAAAAEKGILFEVQAAIGVIGKCDHHSVELANENNLAHIPSGVVGGYILDTGPSGIQFRSDAAHAQTIYLDENGIPKTIEATSVTNPGYKINEKQVERDTLTVLKMIETLETNDLCRELQEMSGNWRMRGKPEENYPSRSIGSDFRAYSDGEGKDPVSSEQKEGNYIERLYLKAAKVQKEIDAFPQMKQQKGPYSTTYGYDVGYWLNDLTRWIDTTNVFFPENEQGKLHIPIVRVKRQQKKTIEEVKEWLKSDPALSKVVTDAYLVWRLKGKLRNEELDKILLPLITPEQIAEKKDLIEARLKDIDNENMLVSAHLLEGVLPLLSKVLKVHGPDFIFQFPNMTSTVRGYIELNTNSPQAINHFDLYKGLYDKKVFEALIVNEILGVVSDCPEKLQEVLTNFYESGHAFSLLKREGNSIVLTPEYKAKIEDEVKEVFINNHFGGFGRDLFFSHPEECIKALQSMGINLKSLFSKKEACEFMSSYSDYKFIVHNSKGEIDPNRPVSLLLSLICPSWRETDFLTLSRGAAFLCNYFGISLESLPAMKVSERNLWRQESKEGYLKDLIEYIWEDSPEYLRASELNRAVKTISSEISEITEVVQILAFSGLRFKQPDDEKVKAFHAVCEKIPEARRRLEKQEQIYIEQLRVSFSGQPLHFQELVLDQNIFAGSQYRFDLIQDMVSKSGLDVQGLGRRLMDVFENSDLWLNDKNEELSLKLKEAFESHLSSTPDWNEIKRELNALNPLELRTFCAFLAVKNKHQFADAMINDKDYILPDKDIYKIAYESLRVGDLKGAQLATNSAVSDLLRMFMPGASHDEIKLAVTVIVESIMKSSQAQSARNSQELKDVILERSCTYKEVNYKERGVGVLAQVVNKTDRNYWNQRLVNAIVFNLPNNKDHEINMLSEQGEFFPLAQKLSRELSKNPELLRKEVFRNGQVLYVTRSGPSSLTGKSNSGEFYSLKEIPQVPLAGLDKDKDGNPVVSKDTDLIQTQLISSRDLDTKAFARTGKPIVREKKEQTRVMPDHYVVDLEWLAKGADFKTIPQNLEKLMAILLPGIVKKSSRQHLHVFHRGEVLFSLGHEELQEMLSLKTVKDEFGKRTKREDFILQLNFLAHQAHCIVESETDNGQRDFCHAPTPVSSKPFKLPSRGGTAHVITDNGQTVNASMSMFIEWIKDHFDVCVLKVK